MCFSSDCVIEKMVKGNKYPHGIVFDDIYVARIIEIFRRLIVLFQDMRDEQAKFAVFKKLNSYCFQGLLIQYF